MLNELVETEEPPGDEQIVQVEYVQKSGGYVLHEKNGCHNPGAAQATRVQGTLAELQQQFQRQYTQQPQNQDRNPAIRLCAPCFRKNWYMVRKVVDTRLQTSREEVHAAEIGGHTNLEQKLRVSVTMELIGGPGWQEWVRWFTQETVEDMRAAGTKYYQNKPGRVMLSETLIVVENNWGSSLVLEMSCYEHVIVPTGLCGTIDQIDVEHQPDGLVCAPVAGVLEPGALELAAYLYNENSFNPKLGAQQVVAGNKTARQSLILQKALETAQLALTNA